jgi:hypothetical protein
MRLAMDQNHMYRYKGIAVARVERVPKSAVKLEPIKLYCSKGFRRSVRLVINILYGPFINYAIYRDEDMIYIKVLLSGSHVPWICKLEEL